MLALNFMLVIVQVLFLFLSVTEAQIPVFPDNIIVFPERDYVNVMGYNGANPETPFAGKKVHTQVLRNINNSPVVIGEAFPHVSGKDIAFDINHPFGYCWGAGSAYQVTPSIQIGDTIVLRVDGTIVGSSPVLPVKITHKYLAQNVITVVGTGISYLADPTFMECRIVQPALVNTIVGRRDVRAINAAAGALRTTGYTSTASTNGDEFTCSFQFFSSNGSPDPVNAVTTFSGMFSVSSWDFVDAAGNAQGMTISEFESAGGPMDATCPPTADKVAPVAADGFAYDGTNLYWNAAKNIPGAANKFNYYNVEVFRTGAGGIVSTGGAKVPSTLLTAPFSAPLTNAPLATGDIAHVRALVDITGVDLVSSSKRKTFTATNVAAPTAPTFSAANNAFVNSVSLTSAQNIQVAYTLTTGTTGVTPVLGSNAVIYTSGSAISIVGTQTVVAVAFDSAGHISATSTATFNNPTPGKVSTVTATTIAPLTIRVAWVPYTASAVTGFNVYAVIGTTKTLVGTAAATATSFDVTTLLVAGSSYSFVVAAVNTFNGQTYEGTGSDASIGAVFFAGPDVISHSISYKAGIEMRVSGSGSIDGSIVTVYIPGTDIVIGSAAVSGGAYSLRARPVDFGLSTVDIRSSFGYASFGILTA